MSAVVIGIGNPYRRDDGVGPALADLVARQAIPGVRVISCLAEPSAIIEAWSDAGLAVLIDAAVGGPPGRVDRRAITDAAQAAPVSSHDLGIAATYRLAEALGRAPRAAEVVTVDVADTGHGVGLTPAVAAALPEALRMVLEVLGPQPQEGVDQRP